MDVPPLTLAVLRLTPHTLIPDSPDHHPNLLPVPKSPGPTPSLPPTFTLSPTHNYPSPFGLLSLGSTFSTHVRLSNTRPGGQEVLGVRMMVEIQGPAGRYQLGEIIHRKPKRSEESPSGEVQVHPVEQAENGELPALMGGEGVELEVESEMKEIGLHVLICSVAWETLDGRRTFQRFLKFNVDAPLAIKTRIHTAQDPNTSLDPNKRNDVSLEVLVQNISTEGMVFERVLLEPVLGLNVHPIGSDGTTPLLPMDTKQFLFILSPSTSPVTTDEQTLPKSVFPPSHLGGTVLPLGRLDVTWFSGPYRDPGRLQTSTLNRRVPLTPVTPRPLMMPTRTLSAVPTSPASGIRRTDTARLLPPPVPAKVEEAELARWDFDLVALEVQREGVEAEKEFVFKFRLGMRDMSIVVDDQDVASSIPPRPVTLGVQYLTSPPARPLSGPLAPQAVLSPSIRSPPVISPATFRPFSPLAPSTPGAGPSSRPMTPVSTQLRQATSQSLTSPTTPLYMPSVPAPIPSIISPVFPPPPYLNRPPTHHTKRLPSQSFLTGEVAHLGVSLTVLKTADFHIAIQDLGTTYADPIATPKRWEVVSEFELRFIALQEGLADLGGLRVLVMDDDGSGGSITREWESLGDVWVDG